MKRTPIQGENWVYEFSVCFALFLHWDYEGRGWLNLSSELLLLWEIIAHNVFGVGAISHLTVQSEHWFKNILFCCLPTFPHTIIHLTWLWRSWKSASHVWLEFTSHLLVFLQNQELMHHNLWGGGINLHRGANEESKIYQKKQFQTRCFVQSFSLMHPGLKKSK